MAHDARRKRVASAEEKLRGADPTSPEVQPAIIDALTVGQVNALNALLGGASRADAAKAAGCALQTLADWERTPVWCAAMAAGKQALFEAAEEERLAAAKKEAKSLANVRRMACAAAERAMGALLKAASAQDVVLKPFEVCALAELAVKLTAEVGLDGDGASGLEKLSLRDLAEQVLERQQTQWADPKEKKT